MKKLLFVACMIFISASAFAQGKTTWGVHGNYMIDSPSNFGVGANFGYELADNLRGVAEFNYFLKKDDVSYWNVEANVEYLFHIGENFTIYPLAGLDVTGAKISWEDGSTSKTKMGLNIGAGIEYAMSKDLSLKAEYNYKTQYDGWSVISFGIVMPF